MMSFLAGKIRAIICGSGILPRSSWLEARPRLPRGNVMIYLVVLLLIFGVLGVTMVSLFSTSITSTATRNDARRAAYLSESGIRYAKSELWAGDFSKAVIEESQRHDKEYKLKDPEGSFTLNVFSPWFESAAAYDSNSGDISRRSLKAESLMAT